MKISELVILLEKAKKELGDVDVVVNYTNGRGYTQEESVTHLAASVYYKNCVKLIS